MNGGKHFTRLDSIRGIAILWVMALHITGACIRYKFDEWPLARICHLGRLGVPMFFVLSGFLIHFTSSRRRDILH